jgi:hypothetical protein
MRALLLAGWLIAVHVIVLAMASGSCDGTVAFGSIAALVEPAPATCDGAPLLGDAFQLKLTTRDGAWLGLGAGAFTGFTGQLYGLTLLFIPSLAAVLLLRWQWAGPTDPRVIAVLAAAGIMDAVPRILGDGTGLAPFELAGMPFGLDDLALPLGLLVLLSRVIGELRA